MKIPGYPDLTAGQSYVLECLYGGEIIEIYHLSPKGPVFRLLAADGTFHRFITPKVFDALHKAGAIVQSNRIASLGSNYYRAVPNPDADLGDMTHVYTGSYRECVEFVNQRYPVHEDCREIFEADPFPGNRDEPCYLVCCDGYDGCVRNVTISFMVPRRFIEVYHLEESVSTWGESF